MAAMDTPDVGTTIEAIRVKLDQLHPGERRVAEEILARPDDIADLSASDLGKRCATSAATVVRACKSLGFQGFQHLRILLVRDAGAAAVQNDADEAPSSGSLDRLFEELHQAVTRASTTVDRATLSEVADRLAKARRIVLVGSGTSAAVAQWGTMRFATAGIPLEAPLDPAAQVFVCRLLGADDVCLAVSDSGMNRNTVAAILAAKKAGATVVSVTGHGRSTVALESDHSIVVNSPSVWNSFSNVGGLVQAAVISALQEMVAERRNLGTAHRDKVEVEVFSTLAPDPPEEDC